MQYCDLKAHRLSFRKLRQRFSIKAIDTVRIYSIINSQSKLLIVQLFDLSHDMKHECVMIFVG